MARLSVLVFTEGTVVMHSSTKRVSDYGSYVPVGKAVIKLKTWEEKGCRISYLTSRKLQNEVEQVKGVLNKFSSPKGVLYSRKEGEEYKEVVEKIKPDILIEDDCASIGVDEIIAPKLNLELSIKTIVVKEFGGVDHLPNDLKELIRYISEH